MYLQHYILPAITDIGTHASYTSHVYRSTPLAAAQHVFNSLSAWWTDHEEENRPRALIIADWHHHTTARHTPSYTRASRWGVKEESSVYLCAPGEEEENEAHMGNYARGKRERAAHPVDLRRIRHACMRVSTSPRASRVLKCCWCMSKAGPRKASGEKSALCGCHEVWLAARRGRSLLHRG